MAFLQIGSNNPNFSFILRKNPATGMLCRELKQGRLFGYYSNEASIFNCFFKDADWDISYKQFRDESFEYVNPSQYNSANFVLDTISEFLAHVIKKPIDGDIDGFDNFCTINMISIKPKYLSIFSKYFTNVSIESTELCPNNYRLKFSTKGTLKELLSFVQLFTIFNVLKTRTLTEDEITKYMNQLITVKAPYFIKYVFKVNILNNRKLFNQHKAALEANSFEKIEFEYGYASLQRIQAVEKLLDFKGDIVDYGCGEGNFIKALLGKVKDDKRYFAIDRDKEVLEVAARRIRSAENVEFSSFYPAGVSLTLGDHELIMSEVIEHSEMEEATESVRNILLLGGDKLKRLIITTPNKDFNQFYFFDDEEVRHEDHHFEMTKAEFEAWLPSVVGNRKYEILEIGDKVNGICCTLGAVIS